MIIVIIENCSAKWAEPWLSQWKRLFPSFLELFPQLLKKSLPSVLLHVICKNISNILRKLHVWSKFYWIEQYLGFLFPSYECKHLPFFFSCKRIPSDLYVLSFLFSETFGNLWNQTLLNWWYIEQACRFWLMSFSLPLKLWLTLCSWCLPAVLYHILLYQSLW